MTGCSAPNCSNSTEKRVPLFRFPKNPELRAKWAQNTRRGGKWKPNDNSRLCLTHFEDSQLELARKDGVVKPKPNAIPTLFNVPNPPKLLTPKRNPPKKRNLENTDYPEKRLRLQEQLALHDNTNIQQPAEENHSSTELEATVKALKDELKYLKKKLQNNDEKLKSLEDNLKAIFFPDQLEFLKLKQQVTNRNVNWSCETVEHALRLRCAVGKSGYEYLVSQGYPLPSYRTLSRRVQSMDYDEGIQTHFLDCLKYQLQPDMTDCVLLLDEMKICEKLSYDPSLKKLSGFISEAFRREHCSDLASNVLIFMLRGIKHNWKQPVAYYFTGSGIPGEKIWLVVKQILSETLNRGINVIAVVSDMGSNNRAMWNVAGIHSIRNQVCASVSHPSSEEKKVYFLPDTPHLLKNLRNCLLKQDIIIPDEFVQSNELPSNIVSMSHIEHLIELEEKHQLRLAHKLKPMHVNPGRFQLMKVFPAAQIFSHGTSAALHYCVQADILPRNVLTTAWFCDKVNTWFDIMNARRIKDALRPSEQHQENTKVAQLQEMLTIMKNIKYSTRNLETPRVVGVWKPIQAGFQLATVAMLELLDNLTSNNTYSYILTGRLTQDSLENLFSQIRSRGDAHPDSVQLRRALKLIAISKFVDTRSNSTSYRQDDSSYAGILLQGHSSPELQEEDFSELVTDASTIFEENQLHLMEETALYYVAGYFVSSFLKKTNCIFCKTAAEQPTCTSSLGLFTIFKENYCKLTHPSHAVLKLINVCESVLRPFVNSTTTDLSSQHNIKLLRERLSVNAKSIVFPECHGLSDFIVSKYLQFRMHIYASYISKMHTEKNAHASRSAFARNSLH